MSLNRLQHRRLIDAQERLPSTRELERRLSAATDEFARVRVTARDWNWHSSTFPSEIVTCEIGGRDTVRVFCKHYLEDFGHRHGEFLYPFYEIEVYRNLLSSLPLSVPRFIGAWTDEAGGCMLMIEALDSGCRMTKTKEPDRTIEEVARWIGAFHTAAAPRIALPETGFLRRLDQSFFVDRLERLLRLEVGSARYGWILQLSDRFEQVLPTPSELTASVVHSDFYSQNVMVAAGRICPVDWETASVGMPEIDLATLIQNWREQVADRCVDAYLESSGLVNGRDELLQRLAVARILAAIYWLGIGPAGAPRRHPEEWRFAALQNAAHSLGVI